MENTKQLSKKKVGGAVLDILTIGMLFASFAALFYSGFILQSASFPLGAMCAITAVGLLLLFFIGDITCLVSKSRSRTLTVGFLAFSAVQLVALIVNLALLLGLMCRLFSVNDMSARFTYVLTAAIVLVGYVASISYFSDGVVGDADEEGGEEEEGSEEEADEEDAEEEGAEEDSEDDAEEEGAEDEDADEEALADEAFEPEEEEVSEDASEEVSFEVEDDADTAETAVFAYEDDGDEDEKEPDSAEQ